MEDEADRFHAVGKIHPDSYKQLLGLSTHAEAAFAEAGLSPLLAELVKIRARQSGKSMTQFGRTCIRDTIERADALERAWCPGPDSNRYGVASEGFSYSPQLSLPTDGLGFRWSFGVWTFSLSCLATRASARES